MKNPMFVAFWKRIAYQVGIGFAMALSIMLARVSDAEAQAQPVGVLVQVPSTGNDCVAGSCSAHNPVPFGGSLAIPYTTTRSFPNGDEYQIDGMISIGENADGTSLPGKMYVTITFIGGPGTGGTSVGAPDQFLLHDYLDYTQNGSANDLTVEAIGSFSSGVGSGSSVTVSAEYCGGITSSPVLGPISPPPSSFSTSAVTFVSPCSAGGLLVDTSFTFNFRNGTTPGSYIRVGTIPAPPVTGAGTHDFYGNLFSDILWRNTNGDTTIWAMNGSQVLSTPDLGTVPASWVIVGQRDFNGDGNCDILWRNTSGDTSIWLMDGGQVLSAVDLGVVPTSWVVFGTGDFNGDGMGDILWRNTNGDTSIWLMNGTQVLSAGDLGVVATSWTIAGTGDFNGDGKTDILWRNSSGDVSIWLMNGTQVLSAIDLGVVATSWTIAGTGDFNGDGITDILWHNSSGDTSIWLMTVIGATQVQVMSAADLGVVPTSWTVAVTGDFNGDGMSDILWRNTDGDTSIWFMNGTLVSSASDLGVVPTSWVIQGANAD